MRAIAQKAFLKFSKIFACDSRQQQVLITLSSIANQTASLPLFFWDSVKGGCGWRMRTADNYKISKEKNEVSAPLIYVQLRATYIHASWF